jgi:hypothetical protein
MKNETGGPAFPHETETDIYPGMTHALRKRAGGSGVPREDITALLDQIERLQEERVALRATVAGLVKWNEDIAHETRVRDLMNLISSVGARAPSH